MTFDRKTRLLNWIGYGMIVSGFLIPFLFLLF